MPLEAERSRFGFALSLKWTGALFDHQREPGHGHKIVSEKKGRRGREKSGGCLEPLMKVCRPPMCCGKQDAAGDAVCARGLFAVGRAAAASPASHSLPDRKRQNKS